MPLFRSSVLLGALGVLLPRTRSRRVLTVGTIEERLRPLEGSCYISISDGWWQYRWCHRRSVTQFHLSTEVNLGSFSGPRSTAETTRHRRSTHVFVDGTACGRIKRSTRVNFLCCRPPHPANGSTFEDRTHRKNVWIHDVTEPTPCEYHIAVCTRALACTFDDDSEEVAPQQEPSSSRRRRRRRRRRPSEEERKPVLSMMSLEARRSYREAVRAMFIEAYDNYMRRAFPGGELRPLTCRGGRFSLIEVPAVTLVDSLSTLAVLGNVTEFERATELLWNVTGGTLNVDANVSVFETTIRLLGGLLSAHLFASSSDFFQSRQTYSGYLLTMARDLGERLLPAFETKTGIPYGTVNLMSGVPTGETAVASLAGSGSLTLEFAILTALTGDRRFQDRAVAAVLALYQRRSPADLLGKHIHALTGKWVEPLSGIGSNSDSFYEYLLKMYALFGIDDFWTRYDAVSTAVKKHLTKGDWYTDVDMFSVKARRQHFENLQAFWPGLQVATGEFLEASRSLNAFHRIFDDYGGLPEDFDYPNMQLFSKNPSSLRVPLRPELVESTYHFYRATRDPSWLWAGANAVEIISKANKAPCGFASIKNAATQALDDEMPSFFLAETIKYLYLLFDDKNKLHSKDIVFSTEAHPFDAAQVRAHRRRLLPQGEKKTEDDDTEEEEEDDDVVQERISLSEFRDLDDDDDEPVPVPKTSIVRRGRALWRRLTLFLTRDQRPEAKNPSTRSTSFSAAAAARRCKAREWWEAFPYDVDFTDALDDRVEEETLDAPLRCPLERAPPSLLSTMPRKKMELSELPTSKTAAEEEIALTADEGGNRVAVVDAGELGRFHVVAYTDGFDVKKISTGEALTVSNSEGTIPLATSIDATGAVDAVAVGPDDLEVHCEVTIFSKDDAVPFVVPCTVAAFGPGGDVAASDDPDVAYAYVPLAPILSNGQGCDDGDRYDDAIVLLDRGSCLFEDKARRARDSGAAGVLVVNNVPDLQFIMARAETSDETPHVPVAMISQHDGAQIRDLLLHEGDLVRGTMDIRKRPLGPDAPIHLVTRGRSIQVVGPGDWGVILSERPRTTDGWGLIIVGPEHSDKRPPALLCFAPFRLPTPEAHADTRHQTLSIVSDLHGRVFARRCACARSLPLV